MQYKKICDKIKHQSVKNYYKMIAKMTNQTVPRFTHTSYKSTLDLTISPTNFKYTPQKYDFFKIFYLNKEYHIFHIQIKDIVIALKMNDIRFVCFPIQYVNCHIRKTHVGTVVFDLVSNEVVVLEPNGVHPIDFVNKFMGMLVADLRLYGLHFRFIPLNQWLPSRRSLNYTVDEGLGTGICATSNLFLIDKLIEYKNKTVLSNWLSFLTKNDVVKELQQFIDKKIDISSA